MKINEKRDKSEGSRTPNIQSQKKLIASPGFKSVFSPNTYLKINSTDKQKSSRLAHFAESKNKKMLEAFGSKNPNKNSEINMDNDDNNLFKVRIRRKNHINEKNIENEEFNKSDKIPSLKMIDDIQKDVNVLEYQSCSNDKINETKKTE